MLYILSQYQAVVAAAVAARKCAQDVVRLMIGFLLSIN